MTVKELIEKLQQCNPNSLVAGYSYEGECDFLVEEVAEKKTDGFGIDGYYCQGDSNVSDCGKVVVFAGGSR